MIDDDWEELETMELENRRLYIARFCELLKNHTWNETKQIMKDEYAETIREWYEIEKVKGDLGWESFSDAFNVRLVEELAQMEFDAYYPILRKWERSEI